MARCRLWERRVRGADRGARGSTTICGVDPSEAQLAFARQQATTKQVQFTQGDALALPYVDGSFDVVLLALVIFFVPDPARAVREMVRVAKPGGMVTTYAWDFMGGGSPTEPMWEVLNAMGLLGDANGRIRYHSRANAIKGRVAL